MVSCSVASCCSLTNSSSVSPAPQSLRCITEAQRFQATTLIAKSNGDCIVCRNATMKCSKCVTYERDFNTRSVTRLLMRTRAESSVKPYDMFMSSTTNQSALELANLVGTTAPYKSPLFNDVSWLSHVIMELLLPNGMIAVKLKFLFTGSSLKTDENWFRPQYLASAYPWNIEQMKKLQNYSRTIFRLRGQSTVRKFMINKIIADCPNARGYMMISHYRSCNWERKSPYTPGYFWTSNPETEKWSTDAKEAVEFRIYGEYSFDANDRMYRAQC